MSDSSGRNEGPKSKRSADPTIVGGRPLEKGRQLSGIPRGIEVLVKKASVDPEFRELLLEHRTRAAEEIGLGLSPAERTMLDAVPKSQIERIIENTSVPDEHRRVFLGKIGTAMVGLLGIGLVSCSTGIRPDLPVPHGTRPEMPREPQPPAQKEPVRKPVNTARVKPKDERMRVKVAIRGINALTVTVAYDCPFDQAKVELAFRGNEDSAGSQVTCEPAEKEVSKGMGTVTFSATATKVSTNRILAGLLCTTEKCEQASAEDFRNMSNLEPGEYRAGSCLLCRVVDYHKVWPV